MKCMVGANKQQKTGIAVSLNAMVQFITIFKPQTKGRFSIPNNVNINSHKSNTSSSLTPIESGVPYSTVISTIFFSHHLNVECLCEFSFVVKQSF